MMKVITFLLLLPSCVLAQELPSRWDELTVSEWPKALEESASTCILPIGILEKHGPHAPIGSDLIHVREWAARATKKEYAVRIESLVKALRAVKADTNAAALQNEFFDRVKK